MKKSLFAASLMFSAIALNAQTADDLLRYSQTNITGTSRFSSMGGAFGALGGDFTSGSVNPAGLAVFRRSEFTISPSFNLNQTQSSFNNNTRDDSKFNVNLTNIGLVTVNMIDATGETGGWISSTFGIGYSRTNNFHSNVYIQGENRSSSLLDVFLEQANAGGGQSPEMLDPFGAGLAYKTNLIYDTDTSANRFRYVSDIPGAGPNGVIQRNGLIATGGMGETVFSFAGNYNNRLYIGASLGISSIRYSFSSNYSEEALPDTNHILNSFTYNNSFDTRGNGMNLKLGIIFRPLDWLRVGGSLHTPTYYNMSDSYRSRMSSRFKVPFTHFNETENVTGDINYNITTPMRAIGSVAFIIQKSGLVSADYEIIDYSAARLRINVDRDYAQMVNEQARTNFSTGGVLRLGTEWRFDPFAIRGGYSHTTNAFRNDFNNSSRNTYSIGAGIREDFYYIDFAYIYSTSSYNHYMYDAAFINPASIEQRLNTFMVTIGFRY
jgi:hypothetical protein